MHRAFRILIGLLPLLLFTRMATAGPPIFFVQDLSRTSSETVEKDFKCFGQLIVQLPTDRRVTFFGSDGQEYFNGIIEQTYPGKERNQRNQLIGQGRRVYLQIGQEPKKVRDYASVLAEILPRMEPGGILVLQGKPLYKVGDLNWEGKIPSLSWAFDPQFSPFGEGAIEVAPVPFRVAVIYDSGDFASTNHRAAIKRFWSVLISRLGGELSLFSSSGGRLHALLSGEMEGEYPSDPQFQEIPEEERTAPLKLTVVSTLHSQKP